VKKNRLYPSLVDSGTTRPILRRVGTISGFFSINRYYRACIIDIKYIETRYIRHVSIIRDSLKNVKIFSA
jgi:hypothetical protein